MRWVLAGMLILALGYEWRLSSAPGAVADGPRQTNFRVAINHFDAPEMVLLPGVGPQLAQRIVAYRDEHGPFADAAALDAVPGIGMRTAERLAPYVRFDQPRAQPLR